ncbi:unnamed protein product, partial [Coccothraustes coccothraustes]
MSESLGWCVEAVRAAAEPSLSRALLALRARHTRRAGGPARFRERGGLGPLLELVEPERPRRVLELALSVLGNCCTEPGCRRQARSLGGVPRLVSLLALPGAPESVWNRVARTLANLALEPEGARAVLDAGAAPLLISLTSTCTTPSCLLSAARALRILGTPQTPPQIPSPRPPSPLTQPRPRLLRALRPPGRALPRRPLLPRAGPGAAGAARSPLPQRRGRSRDPALPVLAALAARPGLDARGSALAALAALGARGWMRPALGAAGAVEAALGSVGPQLGSGGAHVGSGVSPRGAHFEAGVRALCLLCREAVNRARVRRCGGLRALLAVLREPRARRWHRAVLLALSAFAWDPPALRALDSWGVVPLLARGLPPEPRRGEGARQQPEEEEEEEEDREEEEAASADWPRDLGLGAHGEAAAGSWRGLRSWLSTTASPPHPSPLPSPRPSPPQATPPAPPPLSAGSGPATHPPPAFGGPPAPRDPRPAA